MLKCSLLSGLLIFTTCLSYAQEENLNEFTDVNVIPPSPNVAAINKFVDIPVSHYTGRANLSIPIHTVSTRQLSVPITLAYDGGGLKVEERASWVGAGWTLQAGGVISRTTRGLPDEQWNSRKGYLYTDYMFKNAGINNDYFTCDFVSETPPETPLNVIDSVNMGFLDTEPDLFHASFPGGATKFVLDQQGNILQYVEQDISFVENPFENPPAVPPGVTGPLKWLIKDTKGIIYIFEDAESTIVSSQCGIRRPIYYDGIEQYESAWYLTEIRSSLSDSAEYIKFEYTLENQVYDLKFSESGKFQVAGPNGSTGDPDSGPISSCVNGTSVNALRLSKIISSEGEEVVFTAQTTERTDLTGSFALKEILINKISPSGTVLRSKFELQTSYFSHAGSSTKLKLDEIRQRGGSSIENIHSFSYYSPSGVPNVTSKAQDLWGYYNGQTGNQNLMPDFKMGPYHVNRNSSVNRDLSLTHSLAGTLREVEYPTGGKTEFVYELHSVMDEDHINEYTLESSVIEASEFNQKENISEIFTLEQDTYVTVDKSSYDGLDYYAEIEIFTNNLWQPYYPTYGTTGNRAVFVPGTYRLHVISNRYEEVFIRIDYEITQPTTVDVGGLRIKQLNFIDPLRGENFSKVFTYKEAPIAVRSSGKLFTKPSLGGYFTYSIGGSVSLGGNCNEDPGDIDTYLNISENSQVPMAVYDGSHIGYSTVQFFNVPYGKRNNYLISDLEMGLSQNKFINEVKSNTVFPYIPQQDLSHKNGKPEFTQEFALKEDGQLYLKNEVAFHYYEETYPEQVYGYNLKMETSRTCYECQDAYGSDYINNFYSLHKKWYYLTRKVTRQLNENGDELFIDETTYEYPDILNDHHMFVARNRALSDGRLLREEVQRQSGRPSLIVNYLALIDNIQVAGINQTYYQTMPSTQSRWNIEKINPISGEKNVYDLEKTINYDARNFVIEIVDEVGQLNKCYFYNEADLLEAELINYDCNQAEGLRTGDFKQNLYALTDYAQPTYFEYDTQWNISTITNPSGLETRFEYDGYNRLTKSSLYSEGILEGILNEYEYDIHGRNSSGLNSVTTYQAIDKETSSLKTQLVPDINISVSYLDGLGRPVQERAVQASPTALKDIVQAMEYDPFGRTAKEYLPFSDDNSGSYAAGALQVNNLYTASDHYTFYNNGATTHANSTHPFRETIFEKAPASRAVEVGNFGVDYQPGSGHTTTMIYDFNKDNEDGDEDKDGDEVAYWKINTSGVLEKGDVYGAGELRKNVTEDPNGYITKEYVNKRGQTVRKSVQGPEWAHTHYVYDDYGNLRYVLPPELIAQYSTGTLSELIENYAFVYTYDGRKRMISKKVPGAEVIKMFYDKRDRLVLVQDGNLRATYPNLFFFTKYDQLNRPIIEGQVRLNNWTDQDVLDDLEAQQTWFEQIDLTKQHAYSNQSYPVLSIAGQTPYDGFQHVFHTITYYDNYEFKGHDDFTSTLYDYKAPVISSSLPLPSGYTFPSEAVVMAENLRGQVTGTKVTFLPVNGRTQNSVLYYDYQDRLIQSTSYLSFYNNPYRASTLYSFLGWNLYSITDHTYNGTTKLLNKRYTYDHMGRLKKGEHEIIEGTLSGGVVTLAENKYNELGELIEKNLHVDSASPPLQSIDYRYTIQGWLNSINNDLLLSDPNNNPDDVSDFFGMELFYEKSIPNIPQILE